MAAIVARASGASFSVAEKDGNEVPGCGGSTMMMLRLSLLFLCSCLDGEGGVPASEDDGADDTFRRSTEEDIAFFFFSNFSRRLLFFLGIFFPADKERCRAAS